MKAETWLLIGGPMHGESMGQASGREYFYVEGLEEVLDAVSCGWQTKRYEYRRARYIADGETHLVGITSAATDSEKSEIEALLRKQRV